jgi:hypothetical protein
MAQGFAVAVKILDLATAPLNNINRGIANLEKSARRVAHFLCCPSHSLEIVRVRPGPSRAGSDLDPRGATADDEAGNRYGYVTK